MYKISQIVSNDVFNANSIDQ